MENEKKQIKEIEQFGRQSNIIINTDHQAKPFENNSNKEENSIRIDQERNLRMGQNNLPKAPVQASQSKNRNV